VEKQRGVAIISPRHILLTSFTPLIIRRSSSSIARGRFSALFAMR